MDDFTRITEQDGLFGGYLICNHCGKRVERGIANVSKHWINCMKRTEGLIICKKNTVINISSY